MARERTPEKRRISKGKEYGRFQNKKGALAKNVAKNNSKSRNWLLFGIKKGAQPLSPMHYTSERANLQMCEAAPSTVVKMHAQ